MKYRSGWGKIKYEHAMINRLRDLLESIEGSPAFQSIIPGRIKPVKKALPSIKIRRFTITSTGLKAIFQSGAAVQEVFFIGEKERMEEILKKYLID